MSIYIKSHTLGRFVGNYSGLAVFDKSFLIIDRYASGRYQPFQFPSIEAAEEYMSSWDGGAQDCIVEEVED